jgi:hypothetical protein
MPVFPAFDDVYVTRHDALEVALEQPLHRVPCGVAIGHCQLDGAGHHQASGGPIQTHLSATEMGPI